MSETVSIENGYQNIRLEKVRVVNWGRYRDTTVCINGDDCVLTGPNKAGKSMLMDAIKYNFIEDNKFNQAASHGSGSGKSRTLEEYLHGDRRTENEGSMLRPGHVVSYILSEYFNYKTNKRHVVGHCFESDSLSRSEIYCFYHEDACIEDFTLIDEKRYLYAFDQMKYKDQLFITCRDRAGKPLYQKDPAGRRLILTSLSGLKCDARDLQKRISALSGFNTELLKNTGSISNFFQKYIFPENKLSCIAHLRDVKNGIDKTTDELVRLEAKRTALQSVIEKTSASKDADLKQRLYTLLNKYNKLMEAKNAIERLKKEKELKQLTIDRLNEEQPLLITEKNDAEKELEQVKANAGYEKFDESIRSAKENIRKTEEKIRALTMQKKDLEALVSKLQKELAWFLDSLEDEHIREKLALVTSDEEDNTGHSVSVIQSLIDHKRESIAKITEEKNDIKHERKDVASHIMDLNRQLKRINDGDIVYQHAGYDMSELRNVLQNEIYLRTHEKVQIRLFAELVTELLDEEWRDAVESFIGPARFGFVPLEASKTELVIRVWNELCAESRTNKDYRGIDRCRIFRTDLNKEQDDVTEPGSLASVLKIQNADARNFANFLYNGIHLCETEDEFREYAGGALTKDCRVSRGRIVSKTANWMDIDYCLGGNSIYLQAKKCREELKQYTARDNELMQAAQELEEKYDTLYKTELNISLYNFTAPCELREQTERLDGFRNALESLNNNPDLIRLNEIIAMPAKRLREAEAKLSENRKAMEDAKAGMIQLEVREEETNDRLTANEQDYRISVHENPDVSDSVEPLYEKEKKSEYTEAKIREMEAAASTAKMQMVIEQTRFNQSYPEFAIYEDFDALKVYRAEMARLETSDIANTQRRLEGMRRELVTTYRNDYIDDLASRFKGAEEYRRTINKVLDRLPFGSDRYAIQMEPLDGFRSIFNECKRRENGLLAETDPEDNESFEELIENISKETIEDKSGNAITDYDDYRQYYKFRLMIHSDDGLYDYEKVKIIGSGGEIDVPFVIMMAASLIPLYENDSVRLLFMDEAFHKLSSDRIRPLIDFLRRNGFQCIYCTPSNNLSHISPYIRTRVGCYRNQNEPYSHIQHVINRGGA